MLLCLSAISSFVTWLLLACILHYFPSFWFLKYNLPLFLLFHTHQGHHTYIPAYLQGRAVLLRLPFFAKSPSIAM
ncbi:hypothetical protein BX661DRAFT_187588 [Kickxella alabastrina]|uniref:uncharacterized protein n=1 Tax=Kickxella alabastrina TaxID=61397 RepID=UPI002220A71B|nr:uncharacterized protein BX661DRAFT_187588 [Kickxella alabastrina]KAI7822264.1 hypothetical protein BX661DRAFT_187588 [Kickxella alabastrina]